MRRTFLTIPPPMTGRTMLVTMTHKPITLMQPMRLMQNLLMILLTTTSMRRTMPLDPRRMLVTPRLLMHHPTMIGRLSHRSMRHPTMRRHPAFARPRSTIVIHLPRMMKTSLILCHHMHSL
jgi:hypothetical protein